MIYQLHTQIYIQETGTTHLMKRVFRDLARAWSIIGPYYFVLCTIEPKSEEKIFEHTEDPFSSVTDQSIF